MAVLTDLASAEVKRNVNILYGTTLTVPTLLVSDGVIAGYACDVNISSVDASGEISQYMKEKANDDGTRDSEALTGLPGEPPRDYQLDDSLPGHVDTTLHNVPLAKNNTELRYADRGAPVVLQRTELGTWMITGFSIQQPGTHKLYPVDLGDMTIGTLVDLSVKTSALTLAQFGEMKPFGSFPLGAALLYKGDTAVKVI